ncbi:MAG: L,D-transpeptidase [Legionella sp.]|nr:L,D-transpeptidase [Legionella sp.]
MKTFAKKFILLVASAIPTAEALAGGYYGTNLCAYPQYECIRVNRGQTWEKLFPDPQQRDIVQRVNRTYNSLWPGKELAVPRQLAHKTLFDFSPFPLRIKSGGEKQVVIDQDKLAWGAYDTTGTLVHWGPISSGSDRCSDNSSRTCRTMTGVYHFFSKENENCRSNVFPIGKGGAKMPYCMYFHKGFAMHGAQDIPGYRASHGCVRMFSEDAKWLNHHFIELTNDQSSRLGTKVIVRPLMVNQGGENA